MGHLPPPFRGAAPRLAPGAARRGETPLGNYSIRDFDIILRSFVRIRRLRKSPRYLLVIAQGEMTVSANLRKTSLRIAQKNNKILARKIP